MRRCMQTDARALMAAPKKCKAVYTENGDTFGRIDGETRLLRAAETG